MRKISWILALLLLTLGVQAQVYNARDFGAKGDGKALDHTAINRAIDACVAGGGGQVLLPARGRICIVDEIAQQNFFFILLAYSEIMRIFAK